MFVLDMVSQYRLRLILHSIIEIFLSLFLSGAGKPTVKRIEELADIYSFISYSLKAKWQD
jgi:hypothetical protein